MTTQVRHMTLFLLSLFVRWSQTCLYSAFSLNLTPLTSSGIRHHIKFIRCSTIPYTVLILHVTEWVRTYLTAWMRTRTTNLVDCCFNASVQCLFSESFHSKPSTTPTLWLFTMACWVTTIQVWLLWKLFPQFQFLALIKSATSTFFLFWKLLFFETPCRLFWRGWNRTSWFNIVYHNSPTWEVYTPIIL